MVKLGGVTLAMLSAHPTPVFVRVLLRGGERTDKIDKCLVRFYSKQRKTHLDFICPLPTAPLDEAQS